MINLFTYFDSITYKNKNVSITNKDTITIKYKEVLGNIKDLIPKLKLSFNQIYLHYFAAIN